MERVPITNEVAQSEPAADACWNALLLLRARIRVVPAGFGQCALRIAADPLVTFDARLEPGPGAHDVVIAFERGASARRHETLIVIDDLIDVDVVQRGSIPDAALAMLQTYLPYCLAPIEAQKQRRAITVSHFAQTLDGRIATDGGDSRWIGCQENLVHAHRMRALCDAVLIGSGTLRRDRPRLTVRHVSGSDPIRVVVGSGPHDLTCLTESSDAPVITLANGNGHLRGREILESLFERGIQTVLVEGGAATTSSLLADGMIDILQLHIEPLLLGPGLSPFDRPAAARIGDAITFRSQSFTRVGSGVMFVGRPA